MKRINISKYDIEGKNKIGAIGCQISQLILMIQWLRYFGISTGLEK